MQIRTLRFFATVTVCATALIMLYPKRYLFGVDLADDRIQGAAFALCMFLWALSRGGQLRSDPYFEYRSGFWQADAATIRRNVARIAVEMVVLAAVLEIGQIVLPERRSAFGEFFVNALGIIAVGAVIYLLVAHVLRTPLGRRLARLFTTLD